MSDMVQAPRPTRRQVLAAGLLGLAEPMWAAAAPASSEPGTHWQMRTPEEVGLARAKLDALRDLVGGRGCVVRKGYLTYTWGDVTEICDVASAVKPVITMLMLMAVQNGRIKSVDSFITQFEPRLRGLNGGKDAGITWRHLASQTSGYGLVERPGEAWAYNDYALALYYDTLMDKVYQQPGDMVLKECMAVPLRLEDPCTFDAFHRGDRHGRLAISVRDFARFGLWTLRGGKWAGKQLLRPALLKMSLNSPVRPYLPRTSGREAEMLPDQRTLGGGKDQTATGPGFYSFNWWLNRTDSAGRRLYRYAPPDIYLASGHGGIRDLWVIPSLDMVVSWNDANVEDHDASPADPSTKSNLAAKLICEAAHP